MTSATALKFPVAPGSLELVKSALTLETLKQLQEVYRKQQYFIFLFVGLKIQYLKKIATEFGEKTLTKKNRN